MSQFSQNNWFARSDNALTPDKVIKPELSGGERLIWADQPTSSWQHAIKSLPTALFGVPFFAFSIFWTWMASTPLREGGSMGLSGLEFIFPLFGLPFILVGLGLMVSPLWEVLKSKRTTYALTDQRLIIRQDFPRISVRSWQLDQIGNLTRKGPAQGPGSIYFTQELVQGSKGRSFRKNIGFVGINAPKKLEDTIRKQLEGAKK